MSLCVDMIWSAAVTFSLVTSHDVLLTTDPPAVGGVLADGPALTIRLGE